MSVLIVIATDHRGFALKEFLIKQHDIKGIPVRWIDVGAHSDERTDYPLYAQAALQQLKNNKAQLGVFLCGSGGGMAIAANREKQIRAVVAWNEKSARTAREDDNANILVLPADFVHESQVLGIVHAWLSAGFKGGRYAERLQMIDT